MIKNLSLLALFALAFTSCKKEDLADKNADFQKLYSQLIDDGKTEDFTMDTEVHSYSFVLNENKSLFFIGYKSHEDLKSTDYRIEITNEDDGGVVYDGLHKFNHKKVSYVSPNSPVLFESGVSYTVKRIQTNWGENIARTIGELVKTDESDYPIANGIMTITSTEFYDVDASTAGNESIGVPQIDLIFE